MEFWMDILIMKSAVFKVITQRVELISYRLFGKTYRCHLQKWNR